jgi:hypothetical protein
MYTEVSFATFLGALFTQAKAERGIEFDQYPNPNVSKRDGDWQYEMVNGFSVRIFRWPPHENREQVVAGPYPNNLQQTREQFETRFEKDFRDAVHCLSDV